MKKPDDYKEISKKLNQDNVYLMDGAEVYVVIANVTQRQAWKAIRLYEHINCGIDYSDLEEGVQLEDLIKVKFYEEGVWLYWDDAPKDAKYISTGWIFRI